MDVKHIGSKLRDLRRSKNTTQAELALALKTSQQQIARWEAGISPISFSRLTEILQVFEVSLSEIDTSLLKPLQEYLKDATYPRGLDHIVKTKSSNLNEAKEKQRKSLEKNYGLKFLQWGEIDESSFLYELFFSFNVNKTNIKETKADWSIWVNEDTHDRVLNKLYNTDLNQSELDFIYIEHSDGKAFININSITEVTYLFEPNAEYNSEKSKYVLDLKNKIAERKDNFNKEIEKIKKNKKISNKEIEDLKKDYDPDENQDLYFSYMTKKNFYWKHLDLIDFSDIDKDNQFERIDKEFDYPASKFLTLQDIDGEWVSINMEDIIVANITKGVNMEY